MEQFIFENALEQTILETLLRHVKTARLLSTQSEQIAKLTEALVSMQNKFDLFFAKKSEKKKSPESTAETPKEPKKRDKNGGGGRNGLPDSLPRTEQIIDVPEEERVCPECGTPFKRIDDERTELLIFVPMKLEILVQIRPKYVAACECCEKRSVCAELPIRPIDKSYATTSLVSAKSGSEVRGSSSVSAADYAFIPTCGCRASRKLRVPLDETGCRSSRTALYAHLFAYSRMFCDQSGRDDGALSRARCSRSM